MLRAFASLLTPAPAPVSVSTPAPAPEQPAPQPAPVVVALSLAPVSVRGNDTRGSLSIPAGTDVVVLTLEGEPRESAFEAGYGVIRAVVGDEVWRGPAMLARSGSLARIEIPADRLRPDDYIVTLFETGSGGREVERHRYFLRVREP